MLNLLSISHDDQRHTFEGNSFFYNSKMAYLNSFQMVPKATTTTTTTTITAV